MALDRRSTENETKGSRLLSIAGKKLATDTVAKDSEFRITRTGRTQMLGIGVKDVAEMLIECEGKIALAANKLGVTHKTLSTFIESKPTLRTLMEDFDEMLVDFAEERLKVLVGLKNYNAIMTILRVKGKNRGWKDDDKEKENKPITFVEQEAEGGTPVNVTLSEKEQKKKDEDTAIDQFLTAADEGKYTLERILGEEQGGSSEGETTCDKNG